MARVTKRKGKPRAPKAKAEDQSWNANQAQTGPSSSPEPDMGGGKRIGILVAAIVVLYLFNRMACHRTPGSSPSANAPAPAAMLGVEDAASDGAPDLKVKLQQALSSIKTAVTRYAAAHQGRGPASLGGDFSSFLQSIPKEPISGSSSVVSTFDGKGGWLYCPGNASVSVNLPDLGEASNPECEAYYALSQNLHDGSGNGRNGYYVGQKVGFLNDRPSPIAGGWSASGFTDANYVNLPVSVFTEAMRKSGSLKQSVYLNPNDPEARVSIGSSHGVSGDFMIMWKEDGVIGIRIPTMSGFRDFSSPKHAYQKGKWYTIILRWNPSSFSVELKDEKAGVIRKVLQKGTGGAVVDFAPPSEVLLGNYAFQFNPEYSKFSWPGLVANVGFYNTESGAQAGSAKAGSSCK